jgi:DnaJ-class molecular chaperone
VKRKEPFNGQKNGQACPRCKGSGQYRSRGETYACANCSGSGKVVVNATPSRQEKKRRKRVEVRQKAFDDANLPKGYHRPGSGKH